MAGRVKVLLWVAAIALVALAMQNRGRTPRPPVPAAAAPVAKSAEPVPVEKAEPLADLARRGASPAKQRRALRRFLRSSGVGRASIASVLRHTRDGISLWPGGADATSRIGGTPVLPRGEQWPTSASGNPFTFVAAFDLGDLPQLDPLPREGTLALYWNFGWMDEGGGDMDYVASTRAYLVEPGEETHPAAPRQSAPIAAQPLRGTRAALAGDPFLVADEVEGHGDRERLSAAMDALMEAGLYTHRLLGAPNEIQGPVLRDMRFYFDPKRGYLSGASRERFTPAEREHGDWVLLAQLEETEDFVIADGGVLHFVILRSDLEAGRFDRVVGMMESH